MTTPTTPADGGPAFTPGPWEAEKGGGRGAWIKGATGEWAALACGDTDASADANAALIASAPAMFEALRDLLAIAEDEGIVGDGTTIQAARAALRQAEGAGASG